MTPRSARSHQEGFTLIEALLVVGIFSIIALALAGLMALSRVPGGGSGPSIVESGVQ